MSLSKNEKKDTLFSFISLMCLLLLRAAFSILERLGIIAKKKKRERGTAEKEKRKRSSRKGRESNLSPFSPFKKREKLDHLTLSLVASACPVAAL